MEISKLKVGDSAFGAIPTYNGAFQKGWKVKKFIVVRKSDYNIWVVFNKDTVEHPLKLSKTKKAELILS